MFGLFRVSFNLLPEPFDVNRQRLRFGKAVKAPNLIEQIILAESFAGVFGEQQKQVKLLLSEVERCVSLVCNALALVDFQESV